MAHPKEQEHTVSNEAHGHHICAICKGNIRERMGERAVNYERRMWTDKDGHHHIYHMKAHLNPKGCHRVAEGGLGYA